MSQSTEQTDRTRELIKRLHIPDWLVDWGQKRIAEISKIWPLIRPSLPQLYFLPFILFSAVAYLGTQFIAFLPRAVHGIQHFTTGSWSNAVVVCVCLLVLVEAGVRLSRRRPMFFGVLEMGFGIGMSLSGFLGAPGEYDAVFGLAGGAFTMIDGRQRLSATPQS